MGTFLITYYDNCLYDELYDNCLYDESVLASSRVRSSCMPRKPRYLQRAEDAAYHVPMLWAGRMICSIPIPCLSAWSEDAERRRGLWRQCVMDEDARERMIERDDWALGEELFRSRMAQVLRRPLPCHCGRPPKSTRSEEAN
jgi:hypothetical protein